MKKFLLGTVMTASMMFAQVINAETALFDASSVSTACGGGDAAVCLAAVNQIIANLQAAGLTANQLNLQLAALASTLADVARNNPVASVLLATSQALQTVANASTDPAQQAAILTLAAAVASGDVPDQTTVTTSTTPVSPA